MSKPSIIDLAMACTPKQRAFANELAGGVTASEAYRRAYATKATGVNLAARASHVRDNPKIAAYLAALIAQQEKARFLTRERKREKLAAIVDSKTERTADRIKAIEVDNVMNGDNRPTEVNIFGLSDLLAMVRKKS